MSSSISKEDLFIGKTNEYDRLRPEYPEALFSVFKMHVTNNGIIADIGAGTGYLTIPFLQYGYDVKAIEPNADMRSALQEKINHPSLFISGANAQATGLADESVDIITLGNVAHWLDSKPEIYQACLSEFNRILKPKGKIAVFSLCPDVRNIWLSDIFNLVQQYDPSFDVEKIDRTFSDHGFHARNFMWDPIENGYRSFLRKMDMADFYDFMISHSFCDVHMKAEIEQIFNDYEDNGRIDVSFSSSVYIGSLKLR